MSDVTDQWFPDARPDARVRDSVAHDTRGPAPFRGRLSDRHANPVHLPPAASEDDTGPRVKVRFLQSFASYMAGDGAAVSETMAAALVKAGIVVLED